jgi:hypothetical protein
MSPVICEQRRVGEGQVNGCPFGSFWASKMNIITINIAIIKHCIAMAYQPIFWIKLELLKLTS